MLAIKRFSLTVTQNEARDLDQYLHLVDQITEIIETLADRGILHFIQDLSSASTSVMTLYLKKVRYVGSADRSYSVGLLLGSKRLPCHCLTASCSVTSERRTIPARHQRSLLGSFVESWRPLGMKSGHAKHTPRRIPQQ